jgi:two-component system, OmpR family, phosphate regulon sensor histidine kinase PhoR
MTLLFEIVSVFLLLACGGLGFWVAFLSHTAESAKGKEEGYTSRIKLLEDEAVRLRLKAVPVAIPIPTPENPKEERSQQQDILRHMPEGLVMTDPDLRIAFINLAAERIIGLPAAQVEGQPFWEVVKLREEEGKALGEANCPLTVALERKAPLSRENDILSTSYGSEIPVAASIAPILGPEEKPTGVIYLFRDISQAKQVDRLRDEFVTNVSHELRTPLTVIKGYIELLMEEFGDTFMPSQKDFLKVINEEADRLAKLIDGILEFSQAKTGEVGLRQEQFNLLEVLQDSITFYTPPAVKKEIQLLRKLPPDLSPIKGDRNAIRFALDQLMDNAIKFTPEKGTVTVEVGGWKLEEGVWKVELSIQDSGMGIPPDALPHIFDRFYRGEQKVHTLQGTGIGLSIVKEIIELHGGTIDVQSTPSKGSKFTIRLPMVL